MCEDEAKKNQDELLQTLMQVSRDAGREAERQRVLRIMAKALADLEKSEIEEEQKAYMILNELLAKI